MTRKICMFIIAVALICATAVLLHYVAPGTGASQTPRPVNSNLPMQTISIGQTFIQVEVASNDEQRQLGLSNRTSLAEGVGMLFVFDPPRQVGFWMKDMNFGIDMVFADEEGIILNISHDVLPASYPDLFASAGPVRYVLEVPAGYTQKRGIAPGTKIVVQ